jgi:magnesium-protoporphyrin IX monomethyl ester (oxidative) cyclase
VFGITMRLLARGQTNFLKMLWKFNDVYSVDRLMRDHEGQVTYPIGLPKVVRLPPGGRPSSDELYVHHPTAVAASA